VKASGRTAGKGRGKAMSLLDAQRDTAQLLLSPWSDKRWQDTRCGEELQGLAALHRLSAVSCD